MHSEKWRPGEEVPESATYVAYDENGNNGGSLYLEKGKRFPATQHSGSYYEMEDWKFLNCKNLGKQFCLPFFVQKISCCFSKSNKWQNKILWENIFEKTNIARLFVRFEKIVYNKLVKTNKDSDKTYDWIWWKSFAKNPKCKAKIW